MYVINGSDTLYTINRNILSGKTEVEAEARQDGFYGYSFILKRDDYMVLSLYHNNGKNVGDDIVIEWNYQENKLELQKAP